MPLVTQSYRADVTRTVIDHAMQVGARTAIRDLDWSAQIGAQIAYRDRHGELTLPLPALAGKHQADNAALAVAMLRHQDKVHVSPDAMARGIQAARWPARLQLLGEGPLTALVPGRKVWLDGGHNADAGLAIARHFANEPPLHLITGMLANKDPAAIVAPLKGHLLSLSVVPAPGHEAHRPEDIAAHADIPVQAFADVATALKALPPEGPAARRRRTDRRFALSRRRRAAPEPRVPGLNNRHCEERSDAAIQGCANRPGLLITDCP